MNILFYYADGFSEYNSSNFRVSIPALALRGRVGLRMRHVSEWLANDAPARADCSWADIIVLQRVLIESSIERGQYWVSRGKRVLVDFDDAYDIIRPDNAAYKFWGRGVVLAREGGKEVERIMHPHPVEQFRAGLSKVTGLITPSKQLCRDWRRFGRDYHLPNYLDSARYLKEPRRKNKGRIVIGWGGSLSHIPSFSESGVEEAMAKLCRKHPEVVMMIVGDQRVYDRLSGIPNENKLFINYVMFDQWPSVLASYDIGIAPLAGAYDCRRSWLKPLEYIAMGIPYVATDSIAYEDLNPISGLKVDQGDPTTCDKPSPDLWYELLAEMVKNIRGYRQAAKSESDRFYPVYDVYQNRENIIGVYEKIMEGSWQPF